MADFRALPASLAPIHRDMVRSDWLDYNGHMTEYAYTLVFARATSAMLRSLGLGSDYRSASGASLYTLENHITYLKEAQLGEPLAVKVSVLDADAKRLHLYAELEDSAGRLLATYEGMLMHVANGKDGGAVGAAPFSAEHQAVLMQLRDSHRAFGWPRSAGTRIGIRRRGEASND